MLIYDTNTTNFEGENTFDLRVPSEWAHYKPHKNVWLVGIVPSKPKLWLIEVEQISTKPIRMDDNLWPEHDKLWGKKTFDLSVPCEWAHYKVYKNAWIVGIGPSNQSYG